MLVFEERGKPEYPEKNLSVQSREPTNSTHTCRRVWESNPGVKLVPGRRGLSPLPYPFEVTHPDINPARQYLTSVQICRGKVTKTQTRLNLRFKEGNLKMSNMSPSKPMYLDSLLLSSIFLGLVFYK